MSLQETFLQVGDDKVEDVSPRPARRLLRALEASPGRVLEVETPSPFVSEGPTGPLTKAGPPLARGSAFLRLAAAKS
jgi:hypothetical protein